jgi:uncharacterized LabA/DUF88 family protein
MSALSKIALFIDGANLHFSAKALGFEVDFRRLLVEFQSHGTLLRSFYYTAILENQEFSSIQPLVDWLQYNGFAVVAKAAKEFADTASGRRKVKGNMSVELAVDAMEAAQYLDRMVLFSGDGDFRSLIEAVQRRGVYVTVISTLQPAMIADELRRQADSFIDLAELKPKIERNLAGPATGVRVVHVRRRLGERVSDLDDNSPERASSASGAEGRVPSRRES